MCVSVWCVFVCVYIQIVVLETQLGELKTLLEESNVIANTKMQVQPWVRG